MKYVVDTSALTFGWNTVYPPERFPTLWARMERAIRDGALRSSREVKEELQKKDDDLLAWAKQQDDFFIETNADIYNRSREIVNDFRGLTKKARGRRPADPFLVAIGEIHGCAVVSAEGRSASDDRLNARIPNVCDALGVEFMTLPEVIVAEGWTF